LAFCPRSNESRFPNAFQFKVSYEIIFRLSSD
jgi:hypothetical protein